ncbi:MFS transporter [Streptomyces sp. ISL-36]|uniref:MFS transporter n=1 Tax=Streptomyces sp. ISL-36 TaxID=2819182 RepID=UPI001BE6E9E4|nr:MFS transporter [Streptomyces sp. ISL-36]MBT2440947.1 MFS transporter [Streptomyces sp. ISL-36]
MATQTMAPVAAGRGGFAGGFRRLWSATTLSGLGDGIRITAFAVFAAALTQDPFLVALVTVASRLPWLVVGPFAGTLADTVDRWRALWICDLARAAVIGVFAVLAYAGQVGIAVLAVTAFVLSSIETLAENLSQAVVPDVTGTASLDSANSRLMGGQFVTTEFLGAPLGAFLFSTSHALPFALDTISFGLSALLILSIRRSGAAGPAGTAGTGTAGVPTVERMTFRRLWQQTAAGARWLRGHRALRTVCVLIGTLNFSILAVLSIAVLYALETLGIGENAYGLLMVLVALGGLVGLLVAPLVVKRIGRGRTLHLAFALCPPAFLIPGLTRNPFLAAGTLSLVGAAISLANVVTISLRQVLVPTELFGRVNGAYRLVVNGVSPVGGLVGGVVAAHFGLRAPFLMSAALMTAATVAALVMLPPRSLDTEPVQEGSPEAEATREAKAEPQTETDTDTDTEAGRPTATAPVPPPAPSPATTSRIITPRRRAQALVVALAATAAAISAWTTVSGPAPLPADAPAAAFSADRAHAKLSALSDAPHPIGTPEHDKVRDRIVAELRALGLTPRVDSAVSTDTGSGAALSARVQNISATLPGHHSTGHVLLVAHYDSVEIGPGASDDGLGVSSLLESARALTSGPAPRNDITFLFTDGEEPGLMGARAFTAAGVTDPERTVVLNLEARGTSGRVVMFETGAHNSALIPTLAAVPPVATSFSYEIYRLLAQDTDLSELRRTGLTGLNFAVLGGSANYHTPQDNLANVDRSSLQDMGSAALSSARALAASDLGEVAGHSDATYFTLFGTLLHYPTSLVLPLAGLAALGFAAALWFARGRGAVRLRAVGAAAGSLPLPLLGAAATGWLGWELLTLIRPDYLGFLLGDPYRPELPALGLTLVAVALTWAWAAFLRRIRPARAGTSRNAPRNAPRNDPRNGPRNGPRPTPRTAIELSAAVTGVLTLLAVVTALVFPGASYLFAWPALAGAAGLAAAARLPLRSPWRGACAALAAIPAAALLTPVVLMLFTTVGLVYASVPLAVVVLVTAPVAVPATPVLPRPRVLAVFCGVALLGAAVLGFGALTDRTDATHPTHVSLMYAVDADTGTAQWISDGGNPDAWVARHATTDASGLARRFPPLTEPDTWRVGPAPAAAVPLPTLKVREDRRTGGVRTLTLHLGAQGGAPTQLMLYADTDRATVVGARHGTAELPGGRNRSAAAGAWGWGFIMAAPGTEGTDITLTVRGDGPLPLRVVAQTPTLPAGALSVPRPATVTWSGEASGYTLATRAYTF